MKNRNLNHTITLYKKKNLRVQRENMKLCRVLHPCYIFYENTLVFLGVAHDTFQMPGPISDFFLNHLKERLGNKREGVEAHQEKLRACHN